MSILKIYPELVKQPVPTIKSVHEDSVTPSSRPNAENSEVRLPITDLELDHIRHMAKYLLRDKGIADGGREEWFKVICAIKDALGVVELPDWLLELNASEVHPNWDRDTETLWSSLNRETGERITEKTLDYLYREYQEVERQQEVESVLHSYLEKIESAENEIQLTHIIKEVQSDKRLLNKDRKRLADPIQKLYDPKKLGAPTVSEIGKALQDPDETPQTSNLTSSAGIVDRFIQNMDKQATYFTNRQGEEFVELPIDGVQTLLRLNNESFNDYLVIHSKSQYGCRLNKNQRAEITDHVASSARLSGNVFDTPMRFGYKLSEETKVQERLYEDVGDKDGTIIETTPGNVRALTRSEAASSTRFIRGQNAIASSPFQPIDPSELVERANEFLSEFNLPKGMENAFLGWNVNARMPPFPQPPLVITGPPGCGKSILAEFTETLSDRKSTRQTTKSKRQRDVRARLGSSWLTAEHNPKHYSGDVQDDFCVAADGGDAQDATLYQNIGITSYSMAGPIVIASNRSDVIDQPDLVERIVPLQLEPLGKTVDPTELRLAFDKKLPQHHAMLRGMTAEVLRLLPSVTDSRGHRYGEFARVVNCCCQITGDNRTMSEIMTESYMGAFTQAFERSVFLQSVVIMMVLLYSEGWRGRGDELLSILDDLSTRSDRNRNLHVDSFPKNSAEVWAHFNESTGALAQAGVDFRRDGRSNQGYIMQLSLNENAPSPSECQHRIRAFALDSLMWMFL